MPLVVRTHNYVSGALIVASQNNTNETTLFNLVNGNLDEDNFASIGESIFTWDPVAGHTHDGTSGGGRLIDISGAGPMMQVTSTGSDHAFIGSSSAATFAGVNGIGTISTSYGGSFDNTSTGISLIVTGSGGGNPLNVSNRSGDTGGSAIKATHQSTSAGAAAFEAVAASADGYGFYANNIAGSAIKINHNGATPMIDLTPTGSSYGILFNDCTSVPIEIGEFGGSEITSTQTLMDVNTDRTSGSAILLALAGTASTTEKGLTIQHSSSTGSPIAIQITGGTCKGLDYTGAGTVLTTATSSGTAAIIGATGTPTAHAGGWVQIGSAAAYPVGTGLTIYADGGTDGAAGGSTSDDWTLKVIAKGGGVEDNAAIFDGYVLITGSMKTVGGTKAFINPYPGDPSKALEYSCLEGPESGIYWRARGEVSVSEEFPDGYHLSQYAEERIKVPDYVVLAKSETYCMDVFVSPNKPCSISGYYDDETNEVVVLCNIAGIRYSVLCMGTRRYFDDKEVVIDFDWTESRKKRDSPAARAYGAIQ